MDVAVLGPHLLDGRQLGALHRLGHAHAALPPGVTALLEGGVVEFTAATQDERHCPLLLGSRLEFVLEGLAYRLLVHRYLFCLIGMDAARRGAIHPRLKIGAFWPFSLRMAGGRG